MKKGFILLKWKAVSNSKQNLQIIQKKINEACQKSGRDFSEVKLLLATKTVAAEKIQEVLSSSKMLIGENKIQELKAKHSFLANHNVEFHFIGHLQTNKINEVLKYADCIESVDRMDLVEKLHKRLKFEDRNLDIFIQVNTSNEASKFGIAPEKAIDFAREISKFNRFNVKGLMTIGLFSSEQEKVRKCFRLLKDIQNQIQALNLPNFALKELSMGMSGDFETAIEEGATIVRIGSAIFGERMYPDSYYWNENA